MMVGDVKPDILAQIAGDDGGRQLCRRALCWALLCRVRRFPLCRAPSGPSHMPARCIDR